MKKGDKKWKLSSKMKVDNIWMNAGFHPFQMMGKLLLKKQAKSKYSQVGDVAHWSLLFGRNWASVWHWHWDIAWINETFSSLFFQMTGGGWILWNI